MSKPTSLTFATFAAANRLRCETGFHKKVCVSNAVPMTLGLSEEAGEVAGAVRAHLGITTRKVGTTVQAVGDEIADLVQYADLLAACLGLSLEEVLIAKFNRVSERIGSEIRLDPIPPPSVDAPVDAGVPGFRVVGRSGPDVPMPTPGTWVQFARWSNGEVVANTSPLDPPERWEDDSDARQWIAGCFDILEPVPPADGKGDR